MVYNNQASTSVLAELKGEHRGICSGTREAASLHARSGRKIIFSCKTLKEIFQRMRTDRFKHAVSWTVCRRRCDGLLFFLYCAVFVPFRSCQCSAPFYLFCRGSSKVRPDLLLVCSSLLFSSSRPWMLVCLDIFFIYIQRKGKSGG